MRFNQLKQRLEDEQRTTNFEDGDAYRPTTPALQLYTVVVNNLVDPTFYHDDIASLAKVVQAFERVAEDEPEFVLKLAAYARSELSLRDVPQVLLVLAANHEATKPVVRASAPRVIRRADELNTVVAIQLDLFGKPIPKPLKKGVADSFHQFDRHQFAKWNNLRRDVKFRDVLNLVHPTPKDGEEAAVFERLVYGDLDDYPDVDSLDPPETWEVVISERGSTADAWRKVLPRMGLFAKVRNLRNMLEAGLDGEELLDADDLAYARESAMYPFRFYQAHEALLDAEIEAWHVQDWLTAAVDRTAENLPVMDDSFVAVDLSGSMDSTLSRRGTMTYRELASFFGAVLARQGADVGVFADEFERVRAHHATPTLELAATIRDRDVGGSTNGWKAMAHLVETGQAYDRVVFLTDMQLWDSTGYGDEHTLRESFDAYREAVNPEARLFTVDLHSYGTLVTPEGHPNVYHISGWTERLVDFIGYAERPEAVVEEVRAY